jgi:hypothetical protein
MGIPVSQMNSVIKRTFTTAVQGQGDDEEYDRQDFLNVLIYYTCTVADNSSEFTASFWLSIFFSVRLDISLMFIGVTFLETLFVVNFNWL